MLPKINLEHLELLMKAIKIIGNQNDGRARLCFLKPFLKGKILRSSERGVNSILTTILRF